MEIEKELLKQTSLVSLTFYKIISFNHYAGMVLGNSEKRFAIYGDVAINRSFPTPAHPPFPRPLTCELIESILLGFDIRVLRVIVNDYKDQVFYSRLFLEQTREGQSYVADIDSRPSDSIPLAVQHNAPIFCTQSVFENVTPYNLDK